MKTKINSHSFERNFLIFSHLEIYFWALELFCMMDIGKLRKKLNVAQEDFLGQVFQLLS
jgi:hypothetical protein